MTEEEWLGCEDPVQMIRFLKDVGSARKMNLMATASWERVAHLLDHEECRQGIECLGGIAEGRNLPASPVWAYAGSSDFLQIWLPERFGGFGCLITREAEYACCNAIVSTDLAAHAERAELGEHLPLHYSCPHVRLVRDIFGNPFRPITLNSSWRTITVLALANATYEEKAFDRMPILADALEDAGCDNEDVLNHFRQPGEHCRGCWALDLVLGWNVA